MTDEKANRRLGAALYEGFELLDLYGPLEMFGCLGPEMEIVMVAEKSRTVRSAQGPRTVADFGFDDCPHLDLLLIPGGVGTVTALSNDALLDFLRDRTSEVEIVVSVCSGSAILAKAGLLDGRRATSNKLFFDLATGQSDRVEWVAEARWVEDWPFVTSSGVSAGIDAALAVIAHLYGPERAQMIADVTEYQWHTEAGHDPFVKFLNQADLHQLLAESEESND
jgi:putative intracellular protease/amidase